MHFSPNSFSGVYHGSNILNKFMKIRNKKVSGTPRDNCAKYQYQTLFQNLNFYFCISYNRVLFDVPLHDICIGVTCPNLMREKNLKMLK